MFVKDAAYFDLHNVAGMAALFGPSSQSYVKGIGRKLGEGLQNATTGVAGIVFGLYSTWKVSLVVLAILPVMSLASLGSIKKNQTKTARANQCYEEAGSVAYTTISSIRTILSLNAVETMVERYTAATQRAFASATSPLLYIGFLNGSVTAAFTALFAVVVLFGSYVMYGAVETDGCNPAGDDTNGGCPVNGADVFGAMMGILFASQGASQVGNSLEALAGAREAAYRALLVIHRGPGSPAQTVYTKDTKEKIVTAKETNNKHDNNAIVANATKNKDEEQAANPQPNTVKAILPAYEINPFCQDGIKLKQVQGQIEFKNVSFSYPSRPDQRILNNFSMTIPAGKTVALVGPSGGGKSTVVSLLERFYDPLQGQVLCDGHDIKDLQLSSYRRMIGYVGQEPVLFATSVRNNIAYGAEGMDGQEVTQDMVEQAARQANAHDFIVSFPEGYDTQLGEQTQLSGGQKQRVAISRALIKVRYVYCMPAWWI